MHYHKLPEPQPHCPMAHSSFGDVYWQCVDRAELHPKGSELPLDQYCCGYCGSLHPDALMAGFPAGTTSGAPKIRAMEIIDELEPERRSFYAGSIGYFAGNGNMDTCIALRTTLIKDGTMYVQAGAGIVADSDPQKEHEECMNKARALVRAAEEAVNYTRSTR